MLLEVYKIDTKSEIELFNQNSNKIKKGKYCSYKNNDLIKLKIRQLTKQFHNNLRHSFILYGSIK